MPPAARSSITATTLKAVSGDWQRHRNTLTCLAFSPQDLKFDGRFHNLKVTVKGQKLNIQARKGYYAPRQATDAAEQAKEQIRDEVFSQEELHDLPVELHTQFFKTSDDDAKLSVLVRLDVRHLHYRKVDGRNNNSVTVTAVVFDRNGNYVDWQSEDG